MNKALLTSNSCEWETPQEFFENVNKEFSFTIDVCATSINTKCSRYYTKNENGLLQDWKNEIVWCNPPYGRAIKYWVEKAYNESLRGCTVVMLLPSRTDTQYWHDYIIPFAEVRFIKGRLRFNNSVNSAPFPSALVIFRKGVINQ